MCVYKHERDVGARDSQTERESERLRWIKMHGTTSTRASLHPASPIYVAPFTPLIPSAPRGGWLPAIGMLILPVIYLQVTINCRRTRVQETLHTRPTVFGLVCTFCSKGCLDSCYFLWYEMMESVPFWITLTTTSIIQHLSVILTSGSLHWCSDTLFTIL